jgi:hypothetical protein
MTIQNPAPALDTIRAGNLIPVESLQAVSDLLPPVLKVEMILEHFHRFAFKNKSLSEAYLLKTGLQTTAEIAADLWQYLVLVGDTIA